MDRVEGSTRVISAPERMADLRRGGMLNTLKDAQIPTDGEFAVEAFVHNKRGQLKSELIGIVIEKDVKRSRVLVETTSYSVERYLKVRMWLPESTPAAEWSNTFEL
jgi:hypothetical protein